MVLLPLGWGVGGGLARAGGREGERPLPGEFLPLTDRNCDHVDFLIWREGGREGGRKEGEGGVDVLGSVYLNVPCTHTRERVGGRRRGD